MGATELGRAANRESRIGMGRVPFVPPIGVESPERLFTAETAIVPLSLTLHLHRLRNASKERRPTIFDLAPATTRADLLDVVIDTLKRVVTLDAEPVLTAAVRADDVDAFGRRIVAMCATLSVHPEVDIGESETVRTVFPFGRRLVHCPVVRTPARGVPAPGPYSGENSLREPCVRSTTLGTEDEKTIANRNRING